VTDGAFFKPPCTPQLKRISGVRNGWRIVKKLDEMPKPKELLILAERWQPQRTLAAWYLWRAADAGK
jgi:DNA-3-methyladenine glycosylase II